MNANVSQIEFLEQRNKKYMNNTAFSFDNRKITYEEFHERVLQFAHALYKKGVRKGDKIGVVLENTPEAAYLIYALDLIGAVRVGLNIYNNDYKMKRDFEIAKPKMVISTDRLYGRIKNPCDALNISPILYSPAEPVKEIDKEHSLDAISRDYQDSGLVLGDYDKNATTDIIFTGGSSGIHKGVELNGSGLNAVIESCDNIFSLEPGMVHLGNIPFGHMIFGRFALHYALANNLEYALTLNGLPNSFLEEIINKRANGAMGGPVHWNNLQNNPSLKPGCISFLVQGATGGEKYKKEDEERNRELLRFGGSQMDVINMLGLTEMSGLTHACVPGKNNFGTIGSPIKCVQDMVVDPKLISKANDKPVSLKETQEGKVGLLLTKGPGRLLRYFENKEETDKVFVCDKDSNQIWYNTGDLVRRTGNGDEVKFAGRCKRNFVSGYDNIYPEQVEELLMTLPEIMEAVVTEVPDSEYQFLPVYHIRLVADCDTSILQQKIEVLIEGTLGANALPGYINYTLEPFPITENNKTNWSLLRQNAIEQYTKGELSLVRKKY